MPDANSDQSRHSPSMLRWGVLCLLVSTLLGCASSTRPKRNLVPYVRPSPDPRLQNKHRQSPEPDPTWGDLRLRAYHASLPHWGWASVDFYDEHVVCSVRPRRSYELEFLQGSTSPRRYCRDEEDCRWPEPPDDAAVVVRLMDRVPSGRTINLHLVTHSGEVENVEESYALGWARARVVLRWIQAAGRDVARIRVVNHGWYGGSTALSFGRGTGCGSRAALLEKGYLSQTDDEALGSLTLLEAYEMDQSTNPIIKDAVGRCQADASRCTDECKQSSFGYGAFIWSLSAHEVAEGVPPSKETLQALRAAVEALSKEDFGHRRRRGPLHPNYWGYKTKDAEVEVRSWDVPSHDSKAWELRRYIQNGLVRGCQFDAPFPGSDEELDSPGIQLPSLFADDVLRVEMGNELLSREK